MKKHIAYVLVLSSLTLAPLVLTTGCAVTSGRESTGQYAKDKEIAARVKTRLYADPSTKGTEIEVGRKSTRAQRAEFSAGGMSASRIGRTQASCVIS